MSDDDRTRDDETPDKDDTDASDHPERLADVIPLGARRAVSSDSDETTAADTPGPAQPATPPRTLLGSLVREIAGRLSDEARANRIEQNPVLRLLEQDPESDESDEGGDDDDVVDLTAERLRRKGPGPSAVDLAHVVREGFEHYVDEHAAEMDIEASDEESPPADPAAGAAKRTVKIDGEFVRRHGANLLPALLNGLAETVGANLAGLAAPPPRRTDEGDTDESEADEGDTDQAPPLRAHDPDSEPTRPQTEVKFDLLSVLAALIQPPAAAPPADAAQDDDDPSSPDDADDDDDDDSRDD